MKRHEKVILGLVATQCIVFAFLYFKSSHAANGQSAPIAILNVEPSVLIGNKKDVIGNPDALYTLVEFGDYQCPPCASANSKVNLLINRYNSQLNFRFRHFPLEMHEYAMNSAIVAEESRAISRFSDVHNALYDLQTNVTPSQVKSQMTRLGIELNRLPEKQRQIAVQRIEEDKHIGGIAGVTATPTFLLCCPDGRVFKLKSISQAETYLR